MCAGNERTHDSELFSSCTGQWVGLHTAGTVGSMMSSTLTETQAYDPPLPCRPDPAKPVTARV